MKRKTIGMIVATVIVLGLGLAVYNQIIPDKYVPAADEIALQGLFQFPFSLPDDGQLLHIEICSKPSFLALDAK